MTRSNYSTLRDVVIYTYFICYLMSIVYHITGHRLVPIHGDIVGEQVNN